MADEDSRSGVLQGQEVAGSPWPLDERGCSGTDWCLPRHQGHSREGARRTLEM